jgi:hypothetical protein
MRVSSGILNSVVGDKVLHRNLSDQKSTRLETRFDGTRQTPATHNHKRVSTDRLPAVLTSKQGTLPGQHPGKASFDVVAFDEIVLPTQDLDIRRIF